MASNCTYGTPECEICGKEVTGNGFGRRSHLRGHWLKAFPGRPIPYRLSNSAMEWKIATVYRC